MCVHQSKKKEEKKKCSAVLLTYGKISLPRLILMVGIIKFRRNGNFFLILHNFLPSVIKWHPTFCKIKVAPINEKRAAIFFCHTQSSIFYPQIDPWIVCVCVLLLCYHQWMLITLRTIYDSVDLKLINHYSRYPICPIVIILLRNFKFNQALDEDITYILF